MVGEREAGTEVYLEITGVMLTLSGACMRMGRVGSAIKSILHQHI